MKKNLISILILALLVVNVVLTAIMMFSVTGSAKKTAALVTDIASVLNIELTEKVEESETVIKFEDTDVYDVSEKLTIPMKKGADGKEHFCLVSVSVYMNINHEDYAVLSEKIKSNDSLLKSNIIDVISGYTMDEAKNDSETLRNEILAAIQRDLESTFIYKVTFSNIMYQ